MYVSACMGVQVYRMGYPGFLELYFTVEEHDKATMTLGQEDVVSVTELNGRSLDISSELNNTYCELNNTYCYSGSGYS